MNRGPEVSYTPNPENTWLAELYAAQRAGNRETHRRCTVIISLITGSSRKQAMAAFDLSESAVKKIIRAFNSYGVDGLIARKRPGRTPVMTDGQKGEIPEEFEEPGRAQRTFWSATAFHGHVREKYQVECSYNTAVRLLHEKGYVLKVPRPWPDRQDEELREEFLAKLSTLNDDPEVELWYGDETGIDGEPRPRRGWAIKGSKPRVVHNGDHVRLNILGTVCPRTGEFFAIEASHCDTDVFQVFLDEAAASITSTRKWNIFILGNASWHKRKSLNWHFFEPVHLPPYSPDFNLAIPCSLLQGETRLCRNKGSSTPDTLQLAAGRFIPIERIWLIMKAEHFANIHCRSRAALIEKADHALCELMDNPTKVASAATPIDTQL
jgi:transposase